MTTLATMKIRHRRVRDPVVRRAASRRAILAAGAALTWLAPLLGGAPQTTQAAPAVDAHQMLRARFLDLARSYAEFEWQADSRNVLHGSDANGTRVDTPDASFDAHGWNTDGRVNHGMPYAWGGFTSIEDFRQGIARGLYAGHVPTSEHAAPSALTLGLDCSGYIARCWDLPTKQSTRSLGALCYRLPDYAALEPGDILDLFDGHVVLFERWLDAERTRMRVYEAGHLAVVASEYSVQALKKAGFEPLRYKPLDERWMPMELGTPTFSAASSDAAHARWRADSPDTALELASFASPLGDARPREWARYSVSDEPSTEGGSYERVTLVAAVMGQRMDTQSELTLLGKTMATGRTCEHAELLPDALLDFAAYEEPLSDVTTRACTIEKGSYELGGSHLSAYRVEAELSAMHVVRHQAFPVTLVIDCILAPQVPVHGVLEATYRRDTTWRTSAQASDTSSRTLRFRLLAYGGGD